MRGVGKSNAVFSFNLISEDDGAPLDLKNFTFRVTKSRYENNVCTVHFIPKKKKRKK